MACQGREGAQHRLAPQAVRSLEPDPGRVLRVEAVEIVEYVPQLDEGRRTAALVRDLLMTLLAPAASRPATTEKTLLPVD